MMLAISSVAVGVMSRSSLAAVSCWPEARAALRDLSKSAVVIQKDVLHLADIPDCSWDEARTSKFLGEGSWQFVTWRKGKLESGARDVIAEELLRPLWPKEAQAHVNSLAGVLHGLATEFGHILDEHNLAERDGTGLRIDVVAQQRDKHDFERDARLYHRDDVSLRMVSTFNGVGTTVLPEEGVRGREPVASDTSNVLCRSWPGECN